MSEGYYRRCQCCGTGLLISQQRCGLCAPCREACRFPKPTAEECHACNEFFRGGPGGRSDRSTDAAKPDGGN